jgi:hypothetical protein
MPFIERVFFPVDVSPACVAAAAYVKRAASLLGAKVTLLHVVDLTSFDAMQQAVRILRECRVPHPYRSRVPRRTFFVRWGGSLIAAWAGGHDARPAHAKAAAWTKVMNLDRFDLPA